jgi:hypothetical protein
MKRFPEAVCRKRPELWPNYWILHHDNAPAHKAPSVKQFIAQKSITERDLAPNDLWLSPKIKSVLMEQRFYDTEDLKKMPMVLKAIPQQEFQKCFQKWAKRIAPQGEYFEGDPSQ